MNRKFFKSVEVKIAVFALAGLFLLVWGINFLKGIDIFKKNYYLYVVFDQTLGLTPANSVVVNGVIVGMIDRIDLMPSENNKVIMRMGIDKKINIPTNSTITISSPGILSSPQIEIIYGDEPSHYQAGDTIYGVITPGLLSNVGNLTAKLESLLTSLDTIALALKQTMQSGAMDDVEATLKNLHATTDKIDNLLAVNSNKVNTIVSDVQAFTTTLHKNDEKINEMIGNFTTVSENLAEAELKKTVNNAADAIGKLDSLLYKMNQGEGTLGQLVTNDSLYLSLQNSLVSLDKLLDDIRKNPKKYINVTVFGRKEKN